MVWESPSLPHLPRHPFHGAPKRKPSGIPAATVLRPGCLGQFQLSFFGRRAGAPPLRRSTLLGSPTPNGARYGEHAGRLRAHPVHQSRDSFSSGEEEDGVKNGEDGRK